MFAWGCTANRRTTKALVGLVCEVDALIGIFVPAIRAFQFGPTIRKFRLRRFEEVRGPGFPNHGVGEFEIAVLAPQSPSRHDPNSISRHLSRGCSRLYFPMRLMRVRSRTNSPAVLGKVHNIGKCASRTDNDDYKYAYNKCRHVGTSEKQHTHISALCRR